MTNNNYIQDYIKAGKGVIAAKKLARKLVKPGTSFLEIANKCEAEIIKNRCGLSFPINMSLNEIAAHYSPPIDDQTIVPEKGLLKIDIGAHFNGYIADSAFTINIDEDPKLQNYVEAAKEALKAAIELFNPGTKLYELGEAIAQKIINRGLRPITNLGGHELKQFNLHAGPFIPNYNDPIHNQVIKPGDAYACEPFATSGVGKVENGREACTTCCWSGKGDYCSGQCRTTRPFGSAGSKSSHRIIYIHGAYGCREDRTGQGIS